jgi:pyruvate/2-oxoglutarate dehydrogenase complex dihydrolipoamide acyltransferase (E2) component
MPGVVRGVLVKVGDKVIKGQEVCTIGKEGNGLPPLFMEENNMQKMQLFVLRCKLRLLQLIIIIIVLFLFAEAMKMQNKLTIAADGIVGQVSVKEGDTVSEEDLLIALQ